MHIPKLFFSVAAYLMYSMFAYSDIIAPEINREDKLYSQQDAPFIVYARDYIQPCFADYVPNQTEIESLFKKMVNKYFIKFLKNDIIFFFQKKK